MLMRGGGFARLRWFTLHDWRVQGRGCPSWANPSTTLLFKPAAREKTPPRQVLLFHQGDWSAACFIRGRGWWGWIHKQPPSGWTAHTLTHKQTHTYKRVPKIYIPCSDQSSPESYHSILLKPGWSDMSKCYHSEAFHYLPFVKLWQDLFWVGAINHFEGKSVSFLPRLDDFISTLLQQQDIMFFMILYESYDEGFPDFLNREQVGDWQFYKCYSCHCWCYDH